MTLRIRRRAVLAGAATILPIGAVRAQAAWKPASGVKIIVPAAPGGTTDIVARLLAQHLQTAWGDRKSTRLNSSHIPLSRMPSSA